MKLSFTKTANITVMTAAGLLLIISAALKVHQLLTEPIISQSFWSSWEFLVFHVPLELALGVWLISGLLRKAGWLAGTLCFGVFIGFTLYRALIGAESCGCFGTVHVNPWITLSAIDVPFFVAFLIFRPWDCKLLPPPWPSAKNFFAVAIPTLVIIAAVTPAVIFNRPPDKTEKYQVVKPEEWITQSSQADPPEWPMFEYIDIADALRSNIAIVIFHSHECETCHEAIPLYDQMARDMEGNQDAMRFAFIEIPPYAEPADSLVSADTPALTGRLDSSIEWIMGTPLVVVLQQGRVVKSWQGEIPDLDTLLQALTAGQ